MGHYVSAEEHFQRIKNTVTLNNQEWSMQIKKSQKSGLNLLSIKD